MTCRELTNRLLDYRCGDLDSGEGHAIEDHLMVCDRCLRYARDYEVTVQLVRSTTCEADTGF